MKKVALPCRLYTITLSFESGRRISRFPAATLRGGLGYVLRGVVCSTPDLPCLHCLLKHRCAYSFLFATPPPPGAARLQSYEAIPRPFALRPRLESDELELLLIGTALPYLPYLIYALNVLGKKGVGTSRLRFAIQTVRCADTHIYPVGDNEVLPDAGFDTLTVEPGEPCNGAVRLQLLTPLVLRRENRVLMDIDPRVLVASLLRRLTNLDAFFGSGAQGLDPAPYLQSADTLTVHEQQLRVACNRRTSTRQNREIDYSGLTGSVVLKGEVGTLLPLLRTGEVLGVGKNTVFGFGLYRMEKIA